MRLPWRRTQPGRHAVSSGRDVAPALAAPAVPTAPVAEAVPAQAGVRLGFHDGSEVELTSTDPRARALREVADVLLHGDLP